MNPHVSGSPSGAYPLAPAGGADLEGSNAPITLGAAVPCGECGAAFTPAPEGNPRYCEACLPVVADRLRRKGTPIARYRYPEAV